MLSGRGLVIRIDSGAPPPHSAERILSPSTVRNPIFVGISSATAGGRAPEGPVPLSRAKAGPSPIVQNHWSIVDPSLSRRS